MQQKQQNCIWNLYLHVPGISQNWNSPIVFKKDFSLVVKFTEIVMILKQFVPSRKKKSLKIKTNKVRLILSYGLDWVEII